MNKKIKCPECRIGEMQKGKLKDIPNYEEGEAGIIEQEIRQCSKCGYWVVVNP